MKHIGTQGIVSPTAGHPHQASSALTAEYGTCPLCRRPLSKPYGVCFAAVPSADGLLTPVEFLMHARCARRAAIVYDHDALN